MKNKMPRTPFSTPLSGSARVTEMRLRNIFSGPKKRPPALFLALVFAVCIFCGNLVFSYFNESTGQGMTSLMGNAGICSKVNVPKYLFLFSKNVQTLINFGLTLCVFFVFCVLDNITFTWKFICLLFPVGCLVLFNIGVGLVLSALFEKVFLAVVDALAGKVGG